ncbi:M23 family peptidase [Brachybacterium endophyticum]|uniref:M23 family peptidase n=1 Tax=Brachybacterium endophyticum TaxID=2182385 RepID=A0A2U2RLH7_9MICO|nr:M23 family metallopeptidase [Brachybacterium endophyticum]PWH06728.1 M23 family peptidase [Brachybacterium endophyticum]
MLPHLPSHPHPSPTRPSAHVRRRRALAALIGVLLVVLLHLTTPAHADPGIRADEGATGSLGESAGSPGDPTSHGRWGWPMDPPHEIVGPFVPPPDTYGAGHRGVDIIGAGTQVRAVEDGTVRFSGSVAGRGVVSILHSDGLLSTYEPITASVKVGEHVSGGQPIGELEEAGSHCERACLHLGARRGGADYTDPEPLLRGAAPSVLLPLTGSLSLLTEVPRHRH